MSGAAGMICRSCAFPLGRLAGDRRYLEVTPGVYMTVDLLAQHIRLICPRCLVSRVLRDVIVSAMAVPKHPVVP